MLSSGIFFNVQDTGAKVDVSHLAGFTIHGLPIIFQVSDPRVIGIHINDPVHKLPSRGYAVISGMKGQTIELVMSVSALHSCSYHSHLQCPLLRISTLVIAVMMFSSPSSWRPM